MLNGGAAEGTAPCWGTWRLASLTSAGQSAALGAPLEHTTLSIHGTQVMYHSSVTLVCSTRGSSHVYLAWLSLDETQLINNIF